MKIKAVFKGKDGSLGYRTGETYLLKFSINNYSQIVIYKHNTFEEGLCPYGSLKSFLDNWDIIN